MLPILRETEQFNFFSDDYWEDAKSSNGFLQKVREYGQKLFVTLSRFWPLTGWGVWVNPFQKGQFVTKIFFSDNVK